MSVVPTFCSCQGCNVGHSKCDVLMLVLLGCLPCLQWNGASAMLYFSSSGISCVHTGLQSTVYVVQFAHKCCKMVSSEAELACLNLDVIYVVNLWCIMVLKGGRGGVWKLSKLGRKSVFVSVVAKETGLHSNIDLWSLPLSLSLLCLAVLQQLHTVSAGFSMRALLLALKPDARGWLSCISLSRSLSLLCYW